MPGIENPAAGDGGVSCASDWRHSLDLNCDRRVLQSSAKIGGQRFEQLVVHLYCLGPRPIGELLSLIATATGESALVVRHLEKFARLDAEIVRAIGGDKFPAMPLTVIR